MHNYLVCPETLRNTDRAKQIFSKIKWSKIRIYEKKNNEERITLSLVKKRWEFKLNSFIDNNGINLIPILMFNDRVNIQ